MTKESRVTRNDQETVIRLGHHESGYWRDVWSYRELLYFLAWRDILIRYKQTVAGSAWALLRPALNTLVFTILFSRLGKFPSDGVPYPVMVLAGMVPWQLFSGAILGGTQSLVSNSNLISKVYFPRLIIPCSTLGVALLDFLFTLILLLGVMLYYSVMPTWRLATLPLLVLFALLASLGPSLLIAALMVKFRDFKHVVPFMIQLGAYVCPVGFSSSIVPENWRALYSCNPMVGVIDGFRWAIHGGAPLHFQGLIISILITLFFVVLGVWYFRKAERSFADMI
jgi:lipopolysaccharide transport system permease protein